MAEKTIKKQQTLIDEDRFFEMKRRSKISLDKLLKRYLQWCKSEGQKAFDDKSRRLKRIVRWMGKDVLIGHLSNESLESYKAHRQETPERRGKIQPATINRDLANFKHMLTKSVDWGLFKDNPGRRIKPLRVKNVSLRYLTGDELQKLLSAASPYLRPIIVLAVNTGLRKSEILQLLWTDINFATEYIELLDQKNGERSYVPMNQEVKDTFRRVPRRLDSPYIFAKSTGQPPVDFKYHFYKALRLSGIAPCTFHHLRHTFASHLAMNGVDLTTIKELMRHKSYAMTLRYAHLSNQYTKRAVDQLSFQTPTAKKTPNFPQMTHG